MTRHPDALPRRGRSRCGATSHDPPPWRSALEGCEAAYYLVHSLDDPDFLQRDADAARSVRHGGGRGRAASGSSTWAGSATTPTTCRPTCAAAARSSGCSASRGVPVTTLRAGIIVGHGGISWEMTRQLVEHLPAMITPRWVRTRTQPIAVADVVRYLVGVLEAPVEGSRAFDIGGTEVLEYVEMMRRVAAIEGRTMIVVPVPLLTPRLSSRWLSLVTDVDVQTGRSLIDSMSNEVVVRDDSIRELVPFEPMDYDDAVLQALGERAKAPRS